MLYETRKASSSSRPETRRVTVIAQNSTSRSRERPVRRQPKEQQMTCMFAIMGPMLVYQSSQISLASLFQPSTRRFIDLLKFCRESTTKASKLRARFRPEASANRPLAQGSCIVVRQLMIPTSIDHLTLVSKGETGGRRRLKIKTSERKDSLARRL